MRYRVVQMSWSICLALCYICSIAMPANASTQKIAAPQKQPVIAHLTDFPTVDPNYIYDQLYYMVTHFQHREAGYDNNLPVNVNGHDEFAAYWSQEIAHNLEGFGPLVVKDSFPIAGWRGRQPTIPALNVEVSVPGITHPEQVVVIGCHYDGMASSTQSANDDGSGCAIELGVAKAMATFWRDHHTYPARTLRFVIFDAEEQGLFGSFHYLNNTINGDINNIVAMFNEEQNGIAYPLRYLGQIANPLLPFYVDVSPLKNNSLYQHQSNLSAQQRQSITRFHTLMQQAVPAAFAQFQALGYTGLTYHEKNNQDVAQPIFTSDQTNNVIQEDDTLGASDQMPFTLEGIACATFVGNSSYYDNNPPRWSYPFDQPQDTIQLMNTFASGGSQKSNALTLALALPGMLTTWMLNQPDILGQTSADTLTTGKPIAAISDIGQTQAGQSLTINARASFDPKNSHTSLNYTWNFGDGTKANGIEVSHTYTTPGSYTLILTASTTTGTSSENKIINVVQQTPIADNPYARYSASPGIPPTNPQVTLPIPDDTLTDKVLHTAVQVTTAPSSSQGKLQPKNKQAPLMPEQFPVLALLAVAAIVIIGILFVVWQKKRTRSQKLEDRRT